jgi:multidrug efflux pump subunit AcrB
LRSEFGLDQDELRAEIKASVDALTFPEGMESPQFLSFSFADLPIAVLSVSAPGSSLDELKLLVEEEIVPAIEGVEDIGDVGISGGQVLPTESPEPTEDPQPTPEPTAEPSPTPTELPATPTESTDSQAVPLPESWIQAAAAQNVSLATTDDLTAEGVAGVAALAPQLLEDLTPEMLLAMPLEALSALPESYLQTLDEGLQAQLEERLGEAAGEIFVELEPVPLPDSWVQAAAAQGASLETTADLTPDVVGAVSTFAPQLLEDLTPEMLLATPAEALAALPDSYLQTLEPDLQEIIADRIASLPTQEPEAGELPPSWKAAGQAQGLALEGPEDVTVEIFRGIADFAPQLLQDLTADNLRGLDPEVLGWLPADYVETLDPALLEDLEALAASVGGVGALAEQAEAESSELAEGAPELSGSWREAPEDAGPFPTFETAADLLDTGFAQSAAELLNLLVQSGQAEAPQLMVDLTPEVVQWLVENEERFLENLSPSALRLLSPEVLNSLPESFFASLDPALQTELENIAAGTAEAFIPENTINRVDGNPSLALTVFKDSEANTVVTTHAVYDKLDELKAEIPGVRFDTVFEQASFIEESISGVAREGGLGAIFAVVVILIFLSGTVKGKYKLSWRSTLVTAVSIPLSVFMAFAAMQWLPPAADLVLQPLASATASIPVLGAVIGALQRLFPIGVTLNIMTLSGMTVAVGRVVDDSIVVLENIYRHIQRGEDQRVSVLKGTRDVAIAIFASTVTTVVVFLPIGLLGGIVGEFFLPFGVTVTYALASSFLVAVTIVPVLAFLFIRKEHLPEEGETALQRGYKPILRWALNNRAITLAIAGVVFAGSMFLLSQRPRAFLPDLGEPQITVSVDLPNGVTMRETNETVIQFEEALQDVEGLGTIRSEIGLSGGFADRFLGATIDQSGASVQLGIEDSDRLNALTAEVRKLAEASFGAENATVSSGTITSSAFGSFALVLSGDPDSIREFNAQAIRELESVDGLANVSSNLTEQDLILRVDGQPAVRYTGELETEDSLGVTEAAKAKLEAVVPDDITVSEGFETEQQTQGFMQAIRAVLVSILAVYAVMVITFRSLVHPFTILFSLPLAIIGAAIALWITDRVVGISVLVGLMMLVGIVVTNAIVLIDRVQANRKKRDMETREALIEAGSTRLRPILMTAIAAMLALVPLALGLTEGAIIAAELATVVIGGLFTSTILTLLVVPVMYSLLDRLSGRRRTET